MTFLEYVCDRLMGPPAKAGGSPGEMYWVCPLHNDTNPSFHTLPHDPQFKDRWNCFGCGMRGDEADLMKELMKGEDWSRRRARLEQWRQEYAHERANSKTLQPSFSLRGPGSQTHEAINPYTGKPHRSIEMRAVERAWADLTKDERELLFRAWQLREQKFPDVSLDVVADSEKAMRDQVAYSPPDEVPAPAKRKTSQRSKGV